MVQSDHIVARLGVSDVPEPVPAASHASDKGMSVGRLFIEQVIVNFVVIAVLVAVGAFLVFKVQGETYTQFTAAAFIAVVYFSFIIFLPAGTLFACRAELAKGKVAIREDEKTGAKEPLANPVTKTVPVGIALAIVSTAIVWAVIYGAGWTPSPVATALLSLLFVVPYAIIVRREVFRDIEGLTAIGPMHGKKVALKTSHIWMNYVLPSLGLQLIINMPLADRGLGNIAAAIADKVGPDMVPVAALVPDFAITFMFVCNFTFLAVMAHTAADMYEGRIAYAGRARGINGFLFFGLMLLMGVALGVLVAIIGKVSGVALVSFPTAMVLKFLVVLLSVYAACLLGVGWTGKKFNDAAARSMSPKVQAA